MPVSCQFACARAQREPYTKLELEVSLVKVSLLINECTRTFCELRSYNETLVTSFQFGIRKIFQTALHSCKMLT